MSMEKLWRGTWDKYSRGTILRIIVATFSESIHSQINSRSVVIPENWNVTVDIVLLLRNFKVTVHYIKSKWSDIWSMLD